MSWVYFLTNKSETFKHFRNFKAFVEKQNRVYKKTLRTNQGKEILSNEFNLFCKENGIHKELIASYTSKQNGVVK